MWNSVTECCQNAYFLLPFSDKPKENPAYRQKKRAFWARFKLNQKVMID